MIRAADVVVIGGGIIGSSVAYYAAKRGLRVTLVDQARRGRATSASAGGLWPLGESIGLGCGVIYHKAKLASGQTAAGLHGPIPLPSFFLDFSIRSNAMFPGLSEELREACGVDIEWDRTSLIFVLFDDGDVAFARSVRDLCPGGAGATTWLSAAELARAEPAVSREALGGLVFHGDDQVNPYRLADAFRASARALGATILSQAEVRSIRVASGRVTAVETSAGAIPCDVAVNAAGAWAPEIGRMVGIELPIRPVRGQLLGTESLPRTISACLSTADCYLAQKRHGEIVIGSTTEEVGFDTAVTPAAMRTLSAGAIRALPSLSKVHLKRTWSGLRPGTPDELPILGPVAGLRGYLNACGHFRTGILNAPLTGLILNEMIGGEAPSIPIGPYLFVRFIDES